MSSTLEIQERAQTAYRLSPQQARLWQLLQGSNAQCAILLEGDLDAELLRDAVRSVVQRHEILRTVFQEVPGMKVPVQVVTESDEPAWRKVSVNDLNDAAIENICAEEIALADNLEKIRAVLAEVNSHTHLLVLTVPALCSDTLSLQNLMRHLAHSYAEQHGADTSGSEETVQYVQFSEWQNELHEDTESAGSEHWQQRPDDGDEAVLVLPLEGKTGAVEVDARRRPQRIERRLSAADANALGEAGKSAAVVLLACWQVLLSRLSGQSKFSLRLQCSGRIYEEMQDALGLYAKWPCVQFSVAENASFADVLESTDKTVADANEWQEYYFSEESDDAIGFEFCEWPEAQQVDGLSFSLIKQRAITERLKLKLVCAHADNFTAVEFEYDLAVYTAEAIERLADQFVTLLRSLLENSNKPVRDAEMLGEVERQRLLYEWSSSHVTQAIPVTEKCLHELFEEECVRTPDRLAVVSEAAQLTYRELDARANQLARRLQAAGIGAESLVAIYLERSVDSIVALFGILKAGGAYVPLDPGQPARRLGLILKDAGITTVLTHEHLKDRLPGDQANIICLDSESETIARLSTGKPGATINNDNTVYVIFTSGSTGQPKGTSICHRSVVNLVQALTQAVYAGIDAPLKVSINAPLAFDSSVKQVVQLLCGHTLCIVPEEIRPDGDALLEFIRNRQLDVLDCTPSQLRLLLDGGLGDEGKFAPSIALVGGEAIDEALWTRLCRLGKTAFYNVYGPTECTVDATACRVTQASRPRIGRPLANVQVYVLDRDLMPVPVGVMGEIYIGGGGVARGYVNHPDLTADRFVPHPFSDIEGARLYKTGDRGRFLPDGELECAGRIDFQVKLRGYRVELGEIEAALLDHGVVREAVTSLREDRPGDKKLVAYVVCARDKAPQVGELREYLREKLPEYMLPSAIVSLKAFPLTRNGKIDRFNLPAPSEFESETGKQFIAPRTPVEEVVAGIWGQLFGLRQVSAEDNFFDMGGHSLLATQVIARVRKVFRVEVPVRYLFESPTVAALAEKVELEMKAGAREFAPIERVSRENPIPASFAQQRLWFLHQLAPESPAYQVYVSLHIKGPLDVAVLEQTFTEIVQRHEILRTTFTTIDGQLRQVITDATPFKLQLNDVDKHESEVMRLAAEEGHRPFDLTRDPVLRVTLWRLALEDHIVGLTMHHIASDEWSMNLLVREALRLYESFSEGRPSPLSPLPVQYADYAVWQRRLLQGERLESELAYWKQQLGDGAYVLNLPTDRPRPAIQTSRGAHVPLILPEQLISSLTALSRQEEATLFMALLAAYDTLLHFYTEQDSIIVGTPIADRDQIETEELIGFFINMLVMRTDMSGDPSFRELLRRTREVALGAYAHQSVPFDKLVEELKPPRDLSRNPLFQAAFTFDNSQPQDLQMANLDIEPLEIEGRPTRFDLVVALRASGQGFTGAIQYNADLFSASRISRMRDHFSQLLAHVLAEPDAKLSELKAKLEEADRQHQDQQRQGFKEARSRMLKRAKARPASRS